MINGIKPGCWILAVALVLVFDSLLFASALSVIVESRDFNDAFSDYYEALQAYAVDDLKFELTETIEDVLSSGSHLTRTSLDYKVNQIETLLFTGLRQQLCPLSLTVIQNLSQLKLTVVRSLIDAGGAAKVDFTHEEFGMISGVVGRILQTLSPEEFCNAD